MVITELKTVADVEALLIKLVKKGCVQDPQFEPTPTTVPQKDISGFDSLNALEVLTELEEETGIQCNEEIFFVDVKPRKYLALHDIAAAIWDKIHPEVKKNV